MSLLDKFHTPPAIVDSIERYGVNPAGLTVEVDGCATEGVVNGQRVVLAGTNNYLGLTFDPLCIDAAIGALITHGTGTTGSRMANGTYSDHSLLEIELADFFEARSAIVFTTGYQANLGMISALTGPDDLILLDADSHASIYDGAKLSGAQIYRFPHNDVAALEKRLQRLGERAKRTLVVVEGLYSMMGDRAPLREMTEVAHRYGALHDSSRRRLSRAERRRLDQLVCRAVARRRGRRLYTCRSVRFERRPGHAGARLRAPCVALG